MPIQPKKVKLFICIPTFRRNNALKRLLESILLAGKQIHHLSIVIIVIDNNADPDANLITHSFEAALRAHNIGIEYRVNARNIGGQYNIMKAYTLPLVRQKLADRNYVWVIGDDDAVSDECFSKISNALSDNPNAALLITSKKNQASEQCSISRLQSFYESYRHLLLHCRHVYPEMPIHHTLVSCNIVSVGIFDTWYSSTKRNTRYAQMYGICRGLKVASERSSGHAVLIVPGCLLNVPSEPFAMDFETDRGIYQEIPFRWAEYFTWLRDLWGIASQSYDLKMAMKSDYWKWDKI